MHTIRIALGACALLALAACGKKEDDQPTGPVAPPPADATAAAAVVPADAAPTPSIDAAPAPAPDAAPTAGDGDGDGDGDSATKPPPDPNQGPPKNLKVLPKSWSRKQVTAYMKKEMNKALGVKCKFCHDPDDYAADSEHKTVALDMMKMTADINKRFFKGKTEVSCYTCHLGQKEPPK